MDGLQLTTTKPIITQKLPAGLLWFGDMERIGQVLTNLVTNAIKYSPAGGEVQVGICAETDHVLLTVRDFVIGIPVPMQSKVFE